MLGSMYSGPSAYDGPVMNDATSGPEVKRRPGRPRHEGPSEAYLARQVEIVDVAIEVFRERGYDSGTLDDVATVLDVSRASLYHYVPSKAHLLYLIFDRAISTALARMEELSAAEDPAERLRSLIVQQVLMISENQGLFLVFFGDRPALDEKYESEILAKERRLLRYLIEAIEAAAAAGHIPRTDPRLAAQAVLGMTSWFHKWYRANRDDPAGYAQVCIDLIFRSSG